MQILSISFIYMGTWLLKYGKNFMFKLSFCLLKFCNNGEMSGKYFQFQQEFQVNDLFII